MKATQCKWFACVYAIKSGCSIEGWRDNGVKSECPYYKKACVRVYCTYCSRYNGSGECSLKIKNVEVRANDE